MMLEDAIENPITEEGMGAMFDAWKTGDVAKMEQIVFEEIEENPKYRSLYTKILDERNFMMAERIEDFLLEDNIHFVVVGAAHLVGENGIISILIEEGYKIVQL